MYIAHVELEDNIHYLKLASLQMGITRHEQLDNRTLILLSHNH